MKGTELLPDYMKNRPTLEEFLAVARREFSFLASEFGFVEEPSAGMNPFEVQFAGSACRVMIEGVNFGVGLHVQFQRTAGGYASLLQILAVRCPEAAEPF